MSYLVPDDFRTASIAEYCEQIDLTIEEADDTRLAAAIARLSQRVDDATNDHFSSETLTLDLNGGGSPRLYLPQRCTAVTTLSTRNVQGALTTQASTSFRLHSSLDATGVARLGEYDWIDAIVWGPGLTGVYYAWSFDYGEQTVRVTGTFGWMTTPADIKRAVALLVYDHFKPIRQDLRRANRMATADASYDFAQTEPTGIPEVDGIIAQYRRESVPLVG